MNVQSSASLQAPTGKETPTQCGSAIICFPSFCPLSKKPPVLQGCAIIGFHQGTHQKRSLPLAEDLRSSYFPRLPARKNLRHGANVWSSATPPAPYRKSSLLQGADVRSSASSWLPAGKNLPHGKNRRPSASHLAFTRKKSMHGTDVRSRAFLLLPIGKESSRMARMYDHRLPSRLSTRNEGGTIKSETSSVEIVSRVTLVL